MTVTSAVSLPLTVAFESAYRLLTVAQRASDLLADGRARSPSFWELRGRCPDLQLPCN
jgi:hypothetical protein